MRHFMITLMEKKPNKKSALKKALFNIYSYKINFVLVTKFDLK